MHARSFIIVLVFCLFIYLNIFIVELSHYGHFELIAISVALFIHNKWKDNIQNLATTFLLLFPVLLLTFPGSFRYILYYIQYSMLVFCVLSFVSASYYFDLSQRQASILAKLLIGYCIIFLLGTQVPSFYIETGRYEFPGGNVTSSVMILIIAFLFEYYRDHKFRLLVYGLGVACFIVILWLSNMRTVFFFIPYLAWTFRERINIKKYWPLLFIVLIGAVYFTLPKTSEVSEELRISNEENSYLTRLFLYEEEYNGVKDNHFIFPHGFDACNIFVKKLTGDERFSPHNDLLLYWYDWGLFWIVLIFILIRKIKHYTKSIKFGYGSLLLFLFVLSCSLHNVMFHPNIWVPILLLFWLNRIKVNKINYLQS